MNRPIRLLVDARFTRVEHPDGISRFTAGLTDALARMPDRVAVVMLVSDPRQLALLPDVPHVMAPSPLRPTEAFIATRLNRIRPDAVFCPMQTMGSWGRRYRLVLTLHDLIYYEHPTPPGFLPAPVQMVWRWFHRAYWPQRVLLDRADLVATVSETTRAAMSHHRLTRRPIVVIANAPVNGGPPSSDAIRDKRIVYMGAFAEYKNVQGLLAALAYLPDYELRLLSRIDPRRRAELEALTPPGARVAYLDGVSEEEYAAELDAARCLASLSRAEGYGIPLVEAMARGVPVVAADTAIFREVSGGAARLVDPDDAAAFARAVRDVEVPEAWNAASRAGLRRAAELTWEVSATALVDALSGPAITRRGS